MPRDANPRGAGIEVAKSALQLNVPPGRVVHGRARVGRRSDAEYLGDRRAGRDAVVANCEIQDHVDVPIGVVVRKQRGARIACQTCLAQIQSHRGQRIAVVVHVAVAAERLPAARQELAVADCTGRRRGHVATEVGLNSGDGGQQLPGHSAAGLAGRAFHGGQMVGGVGRHEGVPIQGRFVGRCRFLLGWLLV